MATVIVSSGRLRCSGHKQQGVSNGGPAVSGDGDGPPRTAQEEGFGQGPEPLVGQIRWGYNMPFRQGGVKKGRNTNSNSEYGLNGCQERWLFLSRS